MSKLVVQRYCGGYKIKVISYKNKIIKYNISNSLKIIQQKGTMVWQRFDWPNILNDFQDCNWNKNWKYECNDIRKLSTSFVKDLCA